MTKEELYRQIYARRFVYDQREEQAIADLIRNPERVIEQNATINLLPGHFIASVTRNAFAFLTERLHQGNSLDLFRIADDLGTSRNFSGITSDVTHLTQWHLMGYTVDGTFPMAAEAIKREYLKRTSKGKLNKLISR